MMELLLKDVNHMFAGDRMYMAIERGTYKCLEIIHWKVLASEEVYASNIRKLTKLYEANATVDMISDHCGVLCIDVKVDPVFSE